MQSHIRMLGDLINAPFSEYAALMHHCDALRDIADETTSCSTTTIVRPLELRCLRTVPVCSVSSVDMPAVGSSAE